MAAGVAAAAGVEAAVAAAAEASWDSVLAGTRFAIAVGIEVALLDSEDWEVAVMVLMELEVAAGTLPTGPVEVDAYSESQDCWMNFSRLCEQR